MRDFDPAVARVQNSRFVSLSQSILKYFKFKFESSGFCISKYLETVSIDFETFQFLYWISGAPDNSAESILDFRYVVDILQFFQKMGRFGDYFQGIDRSPPKIAPASKIALCGPFYFFAARSAPSSRRDILIFRRVG